MEKNYKKGNGTTLGDKSKTMNVVIKDLHETKIKMQRENALLLHQLGIKNKDNDDDKNALKQTAFKMLAEYNRKQNSSTNLKRKNDNENDEVIETSINDLDQDIVPKKKNQLRKKSKIDKLLEEDVDDASVAYSNLTNETEYSQPQDLYDDVVEVSKVAKAASIENNHRTSPRKQNSKPDSDNLQIITKDVTKRSSKYLLFIKIVYKVY